MLRRDFLKTATAAAVLTATLPVQAKETPAMPNAVMGPSCGATLHILVKPRLTIHSSIRRHTYQRGAS